MKSTLAVLALATLITQSLSAGTLKNRETLESLEFELKQDSEILVITSYASGIESKEIKLRKIKKKKSEVNLIAGSAFVYDYVYTEQGSHSPCQDVNDLFIQTFAPFYNVPQLIAHSYDLLALPVKAPMKLIQNMKYKKDFKKLTNSVENDETTEVSDKRFKRIAKLLKESKQTENCSLNL